MQRKIGNRLFTFIRNAANESQNVSFSLPVVGAVTQWNALDGEIRKYPSLQHDHATSIPLTLAAQQSILLVIDPDRQPAQSVVGTQLLTTMSLSQGPWSLDVNGYQQRKPMQQRFEHFALSDWREIPELVTFSGQGNYQTEFNLSADWLATQHQVLLQLGDVADIAEVSVNGHSLPLMFTTPFSADITAQLVAGKNQLSITVANTLQNTMVNKKKSGYKNLQPVVAGLLGPVELQLFTPNDSGTHK